MTRYGDKTPAFTYDPNNTAFWDEGERAQHPLGLGSGGAPSDKPYGDIDLNDDELWTDQALPIAPIQGTGGGGGPNGGNKLTDIDIAADKIEQLYGWGRHASDEVIRQGNAVYERPERTQAETR